MKIEVAVSSTATTKEKGDLLEKLASDFTERQSYSVTEEVRLTACELDLLCKHKVSSRKLYVECKAYRETLGASVLRQLLGTISFARYDEGWLISAGPLGKDAKGFVEEWECRTDDLRKSLSIYTPDRIIEALIDSKTIVPKPETSALHYIGGNLDLVLNIFNSQGSLLSTINNSNSLSANTSLAAGSYFISASTASNSYAGAYGMLGNYSLTVN